MPKKIIIIVLIVLILGGAAFFILKYIEDSKPVNFNYTPPQVIDNTIDITDETYRYWYDELNRNATSYENVKIILIGKIYNDGEIFTGAENEFGVGRDVHAHSADHVDPPLGFTARYSDAKSLKHGDWVKVTGTLTSEKVLAGKTIELFEPIINVTSVEPSDPPQLTQMH